MIARIGEEQFGSFGAETDIDLDQRAGANLLVHEECRQQRKAKPAEIAELAAYIAGPHGAMITGSMQTIDGGFGA